VIAGAARHFILSLFLLLPAALTAQALGSGAGSALSGTVTDAASGRPVEGAVVLVLRTMLSGRTDLQGRFLFPNVPAGQYTVRVLAIGFAEDSATAVSVSAGAGAVVAVSLQPAPVDLADVVVTATRSPETSQQSGASVAVLTAQELKRRNATTLDQALVYEPGVVINAGQVDIRGSTGIARGVGSRVLLLLDGHPILSGDGGEIDFESLPLLDVDRVEVVKGAYSALYGSNALGGVVNVLTAPIKEAAETTIRLHYGTWQIPSLYRYTSDQLDEKGFGLQHSRRVGNVGARLYLGRELSDGYRQDDEQSRWLGRLKLSSVAGSAHPWDAYGIWAKERDGEFFTWLSPDQPFQVEPATRDDHEIDYKLLTGATFTPVARAKTLLRISPFVNYNSVQNYFPSDGNSDHHRATRLGGTIDLSLRPADQHTVDVGLDLAHTMVQSNFLGTGRMNINDGALFLQDEWGFARSWTVSLGGRLDFHHTTGGRKEWSPSPKLALSQRPLRWLTVRTSVGHGFRSPSAIEQFVNTTQFGYQVIPNPQLRSERAWSEEVGASATPWPRLRVDGALFQSQYRDLIGPALVFDTIPPDTVRVVAQFRNVTRAHVRGVELGTRMQVLKDVLDIETSFLWIDSKDPGGAALPYRSRHNLTGTLSVLSGLLDVDLRYRSRVETVLQYFTDPRRPVTVVDLRLQYRVAGVAVQAKVGNVFQRTYVDVQERNPGAPRSVSFTAYREF
jgi:outer membrane receptor protein involved in Fe transport